MNGHLKVHVYPIGLNSIQDDRRYLTKKNILRWTKTALFEAGICSNFHFGSI